MIDIDLSEARPSLAGPRRPQDRLPIKAIPADFGRRLSLSLADGGFDVHTYTPLACTPDAIRGKQKAQDAQPACTSTHDDLDLRHGAMVLAAITSCTNTSNPR